MEVVETKCAAELLEDVWCVIEELHSEASDGA